MRLYMVILVAFFVDTGPLSGYGFGLKSGIICSHDKTCLRNIQQFNSMHTRFVRIIDQHEPLTGLVLFFRLNKLQGE